MNKTEHASDLASEHDNRCCYFAAFYAAEETWDKLEKQSDIDVLSEQNDFMNKALIKRDKQLKIMRKCLEYYAYPDHFDGDLAYLHGFEARRALEEVDEV